MTTITKAEFDNSIVVRIDEYRIRFHATENKHYGKVYGYQVEVIGAMGWCLAEDDDIDAIPESIKSDFRTIVESFGRVW